MLNAGLWLLVAMVPPAEHGIGSLAALAALQLRSASDERRLRVADIVHQMKSEVDPSRRLLTPCEAVCGVKGATYIPARPSFPDWRMRGGKAPVMTAASVRDALLGSGTPLARTLVCPGFPPTPGAALHAVFG